ncbi:MAG: DUF2069 domain-containing protein [Gammaproteobacteria bacterium]
MMSPKGWYLLTLAGYLGTFCLMVVWFGWLVPPTQTPTAVALLYVGVPLLFPLRGLLHGRVYTNQWSLFLALAYFAYGVVTAWSSPADRPYALLEIALVVVWFVGAIGYVRALRAVHATD